MVCEYKNLNRLAQKKETPLCYNRHLFCILKPKPI